MTDYCSHLHHAVTSQQCGLCWLRLEGDADCIRLKTWLMEDTPYRMAPVPVLYGWDACREKHIKVGNGDVVCNYALDGPGFPCPAGEIHLDNRIQHIGEAKAA